MSREISVANATSAQQAEPKISFYKANVDDPLKEAEAQQARLNGYLGLRVIAERAALEWMPFEMQDEVELMSGPREPRTFVEIEDIPASWSAEMWDNDEDAFATFENRLAKTQRKRGRSAFFARLGESQAEARAIRGRLGAVESRQQLYDLVNQAVAFDNATPAWMFDEDQCGEFSLQPLAYLGDKLDGDFERAEARLAPRLRDQFFARLEASQAEAKAIRARLSQAETREQPCLVRQDRLYALATQAIAFDNATPGWMLDAGQCAALDLRPLDCLADKVQNDLEQAEARLAARQRDQFFARLKASQAEARVVRDELSSAKTAEQLGELVKRVAAFDTATPDWMFDGQRCAALSLKPLDRLADVLRGSLGQVEARLSACRQERHRATKPVKAVFVPVKMTNRRGGSLIAFSQAYVDRKLREGYSVCGQAA